MVKGSVMYNARIIPNVGIFEILELKIRTVTDEWFVGVDKDSRRAHLYPMSAINETVFEKREDALKRVKFAEKYMNKHISDEISYEED